MTIKLRSKVVEIEAVFWSGEYDDLDNTCEPEALFLKHDIVEE
jgi:hypothetical protein